MTELAAPDPARSCPSNLSLRTIDPDLKISASQPLSKRPKHGPITGSMLETLENLDHSVIPPYLKDSHTWKVYARARAAVEYQSMMRNSKEVEEARNIKRWKVQDIDHNAWRRNLIDQRMIYNNKEDEIVTEPAEHIVTSRPNTPEHDVPRENSYLKVEKSYILDTKHRVRSPINITAKRLMTQTMKRFNRPSESPESKYGAPKTKLVVEELIKRPPKFEVMTNFPMGVTRWARRHEGTICTHNRDQSLSQYCDVLGPYVCQKCIEVTNRRIIAEIQKETFPEVEISITTLVAPKLARAMSKGDDLMSRASTREQKTRETTYGLTPSGGILKFPAVESPAKDFKRAGIERKWYNRAKTFHFDDESVGDGCMNTPVAKSAEPTGFRRKTKSGNKRNVTISPVKTVH